MNDIFWVVRYALSSGRIDRKELQVPDSGDYAKEGWNYLRIGKDCFRNLDDAVEAAETMRVKRISDLRRQIKRLDSLDFKGQLNEEGT